MELNPWIFIAVGVVILGLSIYFGRGQWGERPRDAASRQRQAEATRENYRGPDNSP